MEILEHTKELLEELGPEEAMADQQIEGERGERDQADEDLGDSGSERLEEDNTETDNMDLS